MCAFFFYFLNYNLALNFAFFSKRHQGHCRFFFVFMSAHIITTILNPVDRKKKYILDKLKNAKRNWSRLNTSILNWNARAEQWRWGSYWMNSQRDRLIKTKTTYIKRSNANKFDTQQNYIRVSFSSRHVIESERIFRCPQNVYIHYIYKYSVSVYASHPITFAFDILPLIFDLSNFLFVDRQSPCLWRII